MSELDELVKIVTDNKGVEGVIVINNLGIPIRSTFDNRETVQYSALIHGLMDKTFNVSKNIGIQDQMECLRLRTKLNEILVAPVENYMMITVQRMSGEAIAITKSTGSSDQSTEPVAKKEEDDD